MNYFENTLGFLIGLTQLATVVFLLYGPVRKYAFVLIYCVVQLGTSLLEVAVESKFGVRSRLYSTVFWTDEIALDVLLFVILIVLTYRAMDGSPVQAVMGKMLTAATLIVLSLPFLLYKGPFLKGTWLNHMSQVLNFGGAIVNLVLWTALLRSRRRDPQLLMVSAAFGLVATWVAISFGLRGLIHVQGPAMTAANLVFTFAHLAGALILCWAFHPWRRLGSKRPLLYQSA